MRVLLKKKDSRQLDESDYRSKNGDNVLRLWNSTLQILLPVAALAVIWGRRGLFAKFFMQFDKNRISVLCPSLKEKQRLMDWINYYISSKWFFHKDTATNTAIEFWKDGSLLCTLINTAIPGACSDPNRHWQHPPSHGQALAYKYLGVAPVFTEHELTVKSLTREQKDILENYINNLQRAVKKVALQDFKFSSTYIAKGMGLVSGEQFRKMCFYIYLNTPTFLNNEDIIINIRAPNDTYHTLNIPSFSFNKKHNQQPDMPKNLNYRHKLQCSFFRSLSMDFNTTTSNNLNQESNNQIPITFVLEDECAKIMYIPQHSGLYEISIITNGFHLLGSPFPVSISENTSNIVDELTEPKEKLNKIITKKVVSEIVDFLDEKIKTDNFVPYTITEEDSENDILTINENKNSEYLKNCISPICLGHIASEVNIAVEPCLVPKENQNNGESEDSMSHTWNTEFNEVDRYGINNDNRVTLSKTSAHDNVKNQNLSLKILNYLSHLNATDRSDSDHIVAHFKDLCQRKLVTPPLHSLSTYEIQACKDFKKKITFWENQSENNLNDRKLFKHRQSLPNLLNQDERYSFSSYSDITWKLDNVNKNYIQSNFNYSSCSLLNIYNNVQGQYSIETNLDEYMEGLEFRNKFRKRLQYWEKLCSTDNLTTDDADSGFGYSIANSDLSYQNEYLYNLFADAYNSSIFKEKQQYWEKLSTSSIDDLKKEPIQEKYSIKRSDKQIAKAKQQILDIIKKLDYFEDDKRNLFIKNDYQSNLTDDLKSMNNSRENMRKRFHKSKDYFKSLENVMG